ncbi:MAG: hypothetical protein ABFS18_03835 [Thermodesulfobacteriota bacterium]
MKRRIGAGILLFLLIVVPFLDWRLGAVMWMSAWLVFILQKLFDRSSWKLGENDDSSGSDDSHNQE